ncbi:MAG: hypothetical protein H6538_07510 [Bacteroidales bacterium]|nr:hypothetical protein [Bacteroidales bacterium]
MKNKILFSVLTLGLLVVLATGCQKAPQAQMDLAKAAVDSAKTAEADKYIPAEFNAIQDSLNMAMTSIETINSQSFWKRNYKTAAAQLDAVVVAANNAVSNAVAKKAEVKAHCETALTEAAALLAEDQALMLKAPKGKEGKAALEAIGQDLTAIDNAIKESTTLFNQGEYMAANDKVNAAIEKANSIKQELTDAINKYKKR